MVDPADADFGPAGSVLAAGAAVLVAANGSGGSGGRGIGNQARLKK
jgi:hypothetical protein